MAPVVSEIDPARRFLFPLRIDYTVRLPQAPTAWPAYDDTRAFIPTRAGQIVAVELTTGEVLWTTDQVTTRPLVTGAGSVFAIGEDTIDAFRTSDGERLWTFALEAGITSPLLWDQGWMAVCAGDHVVVVRGDLGLELWRRPLGSQCSTRPFIAGDQLIASLEDGRVSVLGLTDGRPVWEQRLGGPVTEALALGGTVYVGSRDNYFYALSAADGRILWRWRTGADIVGDPLIDSSRVYFGSYDNVIRALDRRHGAQRWKQSLPIRPLWAPDVMDDIVVVSGLGAEVRGYRAETGEAAGFFMAPAELASPPHLVDGELAEDRRVYILTRNGDFISLLHRIDPLIEPLETLPGTASPIPPLPGVLPGLPIGRPLRVTGGYFLPGPVGLPPALQPAPVFGPVVGLPPGPTWQPGFSIGFPPPLPAQQLPGRRLTFPPAPYWFEFRGIDLGRPAPPDSIRLPGLMVGMPPPLVPAPRIELPGLVLAAESAPAASVVPAAEPPTDGGEPAVPPPSSGDPPVPPGV